MPGPPMAGPRAAVDWLGATDGFVETLQPYSRPLDRNLSRLCLCDEALARVVRLPFRASEPIPRNGSCPACHFRLWDRQGSSLRRCYHNARNIAAREVLP